jgi:hypothetical protein
MTTINELLNAQRVVYDALHPYSKDERDRIIRRVFEDLNRERSPMRLRAIEPGPLPEVVW